MRMWMINPMYMCRKHLLGEHVECHMLQAWVDKRKATLDGFREIVEVHNIVQRHDALVREMLNRGYNHKSPITPSKSYKFGRVDRTRSLLDLVNRCEECQVRAAVLMDNRHRQWHDKGARRLSAHLYAKSWSLLSLWAINEISSRGW